MFFNGIFIDLISIFDKIFEINKVGSLFT